MRRVVTVIFVVVVVVLATAAAHAQTGWRDRIRNFDLNDYAVGVWVVNSDSIYKGVGTNTYMFPAPTRFSNALFKHLYT